VPWVSAPIEIECFGGPCDGETISVPPHLAIAGGHVRAPVEGKGTPAEDYVLARDAGRLVALYRRAVELDD
jgi:hypothetical protein